MIGGGYFSQVSGLGRREPGSGVQVRVQVRVLNFTLHPHLTLITRTRDLRAETWDPKMHCFWPSEPLALRPSIHTIPA
jgi:hypothetical protein